MQKTFFGFAIGSLVAISSMPAYSLDAMMTGANGYSVSDPLFTVGDTFGGYAPPGILDGMGAYEKGDGTVRVLATHELRNNRGYDYSVNNGLGGTFDMDGARISYFDIDKNTREIIGSGLAFHTIYDANGNIATDKSFLANNLNGFSRFCSAQLVEANQFKPGNSAGKGKANARGIVNRVFFTGEEDGGNFNPVGGAEWALDVETGNIWHLPAFGRGAWENITQIDTGNDARVAFLLADDSSPFDSDGDTVKEAAPLYLYVGKKQPNGDFRERNGLSDGKLYVWVSDNGETSPLDFRGSGKLSGKWIEIDNSPSGTPSEIGAFGYDEFGYPTQRTLWNRAEALGAFGFSRPEDVSTNPYDGSEAVLASTGVDTFAVENGIGVDTFGTIYTIKTNFENMTADLTIIYDGDAHATRALRSPDNLDWADDGYIYIQEDEAEEDTLLGEVLFGAGAVNPNAAGIVRLDPTTGMTLRVANIDRSVVLDASIADPANAVDKDAGQAGEWESSGIIDVSTLFGEPGGTLFLFNVQAHGIEDQDGFNAGSRIHDDDLVEGGQLLFLTKD